MQTRHASLQLGHLQIPASEPATARPDDRPLLLAALLIATVTILRIVYLANYPPLELAADEAHYWDWSRHLDWSYYSKGPLVAWLIRLSCALLGGDTLLAVRLPAVLLGALTLLGIYQLTNQTLRRPWLALVAVGLLATYPVFNVGALLMTIDAPYLCAWTWAVVVGQWLVKSPRVATRGLGGWCLLGLIVGAGILAKYTMVLFFPALVLFCVVVKEKRVWFRRPGPYLSVIVAALCCVPILLWNAQHGWVTLRHVGGQAGFTGSEFGQRVGGLNWLGPMEFVAGQFALLLGAGFILWLFALAKAIREFFQSATGIPNAAAQSERTYLAIMSLVPFVTFLVFSLKTKVQLNWPLAAYLPALPLMVELLAAAWARWGIGRRSALAVGMAGCIFLSIVSLRTEWLYPLMNRWQEALPARKWDPTCRLRGWSTLAETVEAKRRELAGQGIEPVLAGTMWNQPGAVAFYLPDQPTVYCLGQLAGDRQSQYDFWPPHPAHQPEAFVGRTFLIIGWAPKSLWRHFERVEKPTIVTHNVGGQVVASWAVTVAHGFQKAEKSREPLEPKTEHRE